MRLIPFLAALIALGPTRASAERFFYQIQVNHLGSMKGRVSFNGVTLSDFADSGSYSGALNVWLRPGENEIQLHLEKGAKATDPGDKVELYVVEARAGQFADEVPRLLTLNWKNGDPLPTDLKAKFKAPRAPAVDLWTKAEAAPLDDAAKKALTDLVQKFHQAVSKRDAKAMLALATFKIEDMGRALGMDPKEAFKEASKELEASMAELPKASRPVPFDPIGLRFVPMADGKLVKVTGDKGQPPVVIRGKDGEASFEVFAARIGGTWMIVR
jgi:hypothetical protein